MCCIVMQFIDVMYCNEIHWCNVMCSIVVQCIDLWCNATECNDDTGAAIYVAFVEQSSISLVVVLVVIISCIIKQSSVSVMVERQAA